MAISTCWRSTAWRPASCISTTRSPTGRRAVAATPAEIMRLDGAGTLAAGGPADLVVFKGRSWTELLSRPESDRIVVRDGTAIERDLARLCRTRRSDGCDVNGSSPALKRDLDGLKIEDNPAIVQQKSRDFYWYSPVLKRQLDHVTGDLVVSPKSEAEVIRVLAACHRHGVPVTPRGTGTGNYGQAMPLSGGVVLSLAEMNAVKSIAPGRVVDRPGRDPRRHRPRDARAFRPGTAAAPSTYNTASIGGFIAGGSGGVGSINWGGLARSRQRHPAARRHHGGRAARARTHRRGPAQGHPCLRHQRHHHRGRDAADRRL